MARRDRIELPHAVFDAVNDRQDRQQDKPERITRAQDGKKR
jgi:hypothetical protein